MFAPIFFTGSLLVKVSGTVQRATNFEWLHLIHLKFFRRFVCMGVKRNTYRILVGKPEGTRLLGRPRRKLVDNIKIDLREIWWDGVDWIDMAQDSGWLL
jgi:hypothetical protein